MLSQLAKPMALLHCAQQRSINGQHNQKRQAHTSEHRGT
jgi:hypothetical protein